MNNINNDINRFDNKYLKCVVSKYKSVLNYLANSGSMIILQPQSEQNKLYKINDKYYNRNYIYLGNEFLASGYGFLCEEMRDDAEAIVINYAATIKALKNADATETKERIKSDNYLQLQLDRLIQTNGGDIGNTVITINDKTISTKDVILYGEEAHYDNLIVENVNISIITYNNDTYQVVDNNVMLPIGSKIKTIKIEIITLDNDSGGLSNLQVIHDYHDGTNEGVIIDYDADAESSTIIDNVDQKFNKHKYIYSKTFNENDAIIVENDDIIYNIIKGIYLYVKATPIDKYKNYPGLLLKGIEIVSSGNAIKDNKIDLNINVNIIPQYFITSNVNPSITNTFNINEFFSNNITYKNIEINNIYDNVISNIVLPITTKTNDNILYLAIPSNFVLEEIYFIKSSDVININEQYNIKGATSIYKHNILLPCPKTYNNLNVYSTYSSIKYNIYKIITNDKKQIINYIKIILRYIKVSNNVKFNNIENMNTYNDEQSSDNNIYVLNDESFNSMYWIDASKYLNDTENNKIKEKLDLVKNQFV